MLYRDEASKAMGIDWMSRDEMSQAIPPAYTEYIGRYLLAQVKRQNTKRSHPPRVG
jgi:DNA (cytosine-5)-methyltransferase 1